jgi:Tfp pilus assembly protein PilF
VSKHKTLNETEAGKLELNLLNEKGSNELQGDKIKTIEAARAKLIKKIEEQELRYSFDNFLESIKKHLAEGERCCFFLGAGASIESGIPSAYSLVRVWDSEIEAYHNDYSEKYVFWKNKHSITYDNIANFYSKCYEWRFPNEREGHLYLQKAIREAYPSRGYGMLANILVNSDNNVVITTNFDQLIQREISKLNKDCIILSHESILQQALSTDLTTTNVPVIVKLHRDLYLNPLNRENELKTLYSGWNELLSMIFSKYHAIFCGYSGNDPNVYSFLRENANKFKNGVFKSPYWLVYDSPSNNTLFQNDYNKLRDFFIQANCRVIAHKGFDWSIGRIFENITGVPAINWRSTPSEMLSDIRKVSYERQRELIDQCLKVYKNDFIALSSYASIEEENEHFDEADRLYSLSIEINPFSVNALSNYAGFLESAKHDASRANELYQCALNISPEDSVLLGNYAMFLENCLLDYDTAEKYYKQALSGDYIYEYLSYNYAEFLITKRKSPKDAKEFFETTLKQHPDYYFVIGEYAMFCHIVLLEYELADKLYKQYLKMDSSSPSILSHYAAFLDEVKHRKNQAIKYYRLALKIDSEYSFALGHLAILLQDKSDKIQAEWMYQRAIKFDPYDAVWHFNYAIFLEEEKDDYNMAMYHYRRALE